MEAEGRICYICHGEETADDPFVVQPQCVCMGSNVLHGACFKRLLEKGQENCSICKMRWAFLPTLCQFVQVRQGTSYSVECMKDSKGRYYGPYKEWWMDKTQTLGGPLHMEAQYRNGVLDGWMIVYDRAGRLRRRAFYEDGVKQGAAVYHRKGVTLVYCGFLNGARHGQSLFLKKDGSYHFVSDYYYGAAMKRGPSL